MWRIQFEISTTPDTGSLQVAGFQYARDPGAATPRGWTGVPVWVVIEGDQDIGLTQGSLPQSAQVMKIARANEGKGRRIRAYFSKKPFHNSRWRAVAELRTPGKVVVIGRTANGIGAPSSVQVNDPAGHSISRLTFHVSREALFSAGLARVD